MLYTKQKVEAAADFLITQMFFDNRFFYNFEERAEKIGITVPIIPGIMPITNFEKIRRFARMCGASVPPQFGSLMDTHRGSPQDIRKIGIQYATEQCRDLLTNGVRLFHFHTLNQWGPVSEIIANLPIRAA
jgi:methylenetetrahydrofolate reductase (NADPH)